MSKEELASLSMEVLGLLLFGLVFVMLWIAHRNKHNPQINLNYLLYDKATGSVTLAKLIGLLGAAAGTWVFIYLPIRGSFDSVYAIAYLTVMILGKVAGDITPKIFNPPNGDAK